MRIRYDREVNAIYVTLVEESAEISNFRITPMVAVDLMVDDRVFGIEALDAFGSQGDKKPEVSYDREVDAMYIKLRPGETECHNEIINDRVTLDLDTEDQLVGIEILDASEVLGFEDEPRISYEVIESELIEPVSQ